MSVRPVGSSVPEASEPATRSTALLSRTEVYGDLRHGMRVKVVSDRWSRFRGLQWEFLCHVTNVQTGKEWVELYGGPRGHTTIHAFPVAAIRFVR